MQKEPKQALRRCLGLREAVTLTAGTVIGVGLFTLGGNAVGMLGRSVVLATLAALLVSIYPAMLYAEMGAALPFAGGTYQYARRGLGRPFGVVAGLCFILSMVSVASGEALAFSFYVRTLAETLGFSLPIGDTALACLAVAGFLALGVRGAGITGRMQNGFLFFFWGVAAVWAASMLPAFAASPGGAAAVHAGPGGFLSCVALVWWCFAGFETCCAFGEELRYPQIDLPRALRLAPFLVFATTALFQWALVRVVPAGALAALASADAPYAYGLRSAGIVGLPLALLCLGIAFGGDFSTLGASVTAPARYLYTMARDGALPAVFARVHPKYRTPHVATLALGALMLVLVATGSIAAVASLSLFATLTYYILGMASAWGLRRRFPALPRPYRAPGLALGAPLSAAVYLLLLASLPLGAVAAGLAWCALGLGVSALCTRGKGMEPPADPPLPAPPPEEERRRMDRAWRVWVCAAALLSVLALILFVFA